MDEPRQERAGFSRREALRRGAGVGGTLLWVAPAVQSIGMTRALAQTPSPGGGEEEPPEAVDGPSFIALNIESTNSSRGRTTAYSIKYEGCTAPEDCFESDPGATPGCESIYSPEGRPEDGDNLGLVVTGPDPSTGCVSIEVPSGYVVTSSVVKNGQTCCPGPTGGGTLIFCPC